MIPVIQQDYTENPYVNIITSKQVSESSSSVENLGLFTRSDASSASTILTSACRDLFIILYP